MERMRVRTDLALEAKESFSGSDVEVHGVVVEEEYDKEQNLRLTRVRIESERGAREMGKPIGTYLTLEAPGMASPDEDYHREISEAGRVSERIDGGTEESVCSGGGTWQPGCDAGCAGTEDGFQPVDHKTSDPGVWSGSHGCGRLL